MLRRVGRIILATVLAVVGVCVLVVIGAIVFFYLNGGMWPGTHSNPGHFPH